MLKQLDSNIFHSTYYHNTSLTDLSRMLKMLAYQRKQFLKKKQLIGFRKFFALLQTCVSYIRSCVYRSLSSFTLRTSCKIYFLLGKKNYLHYKITAAAYVVL